MTRILKYRIDLTDQQVIEMPYGAKALSVWEQNGELCIWAMVNDSSPSNYHIRVVGTGHPCDDVATMQYVGTVLTRTQRLVWHVFVEPEHR